MRRVWIGGVVLAAALTGCGVHTQSTPQPIEAPTPGPTATPTIDRDASPSPCGSPTLSASPSSAPSSGPAWPPVLAVSGALPPRSAAIKELLRL